MKLSETGLFAIRALGTVMILAGSMLGGWLLCRHYHAPVWALLASLLPVGVGTFLFATGTMVSPGHCGEGCTGRDCTFCGRQS